ncbi:MAG: hypothetical protein JST83_16640 [Bacteroidetes bacterium]|nr:hypothetical protein [Bacteroidota bacterium]
MKRLLLLMGLSLGLCARGVCQISLSDSIAHYFQNHQLDSTHLAKMLMKTPEMGDYQGGETDPALQLYPLIPDSFLSVLHRDSSSFKIVLVWSCWSKYGIEQMLTHRALFDQNNYDVYLISADLNNDTQSDTVKRFLSYLGVRDQAYQIVAPVSLTDLQNSWPVAKTLAWLTEQPAPLCTC